MKLDADYMKRILQLLINTPSPSGYCEVIMEKLAQEVGELGYTLERTRKGCGMVRVAGEGQVQGPVLGISAHVDTLGAMVRSIKESGRLRFTSIGGYMMGSVENEYCQVHTTQGGTVPGTILTTQPSVHVYSGARDQKREESEMEVRLDELVGSRADVEALGIRPGCYISFDPRLAMYDNGYIKSRHLDDKAGVAAVLGLLEALRREGRAPKRPLVLFISTYEEVGHGSAWMPSDVEELIAVDMGALGDDLTGSDQQVSICAKDSSGPYDHGMTTRLIQLAEREAIPYAVDVYPHYGSDASAALRGGQDVRAALVGPGVHASHGMERTHIDAIVGTAALLYAYVMEPVV